MKHLLLLIALFLLTLSGQAQTVLVQENFETDGEGTRYTSNHFDFRAPNATTQYFTRETNPVSTFTTTTIGNSGSGTTNGTYFWACEGVRGPFTTIIRDPGTVTLNPAGVTSYANLSVTVALADARATGRSTATPNDHVRVQYSYDNVTFTTIGDFTGTSAGSNWRRVGTTDELTSTLQDFTFSIGTPAGANLYVRVEADYAGGSKEIAFDNIRLTGTLSVSPLTLTGIESTTLFYAEGGPPAQVTNTIVPGNPTGTTFTGASVQIQAGFVSGQDALAFTPGNGISGVYNSATGLLTLSGTASVAAYQAALRSVTYRNSNSTNATAGPRTLTFTVSDATRTSPAQSRLINVTTFLNGPTPLNYTENFETDGEGTRYGSNTFSRNAQAFIRATQNPLPGTSSTTFGNIEQSGYWYAEGTKDNTSERIGTLLLAPVNATGFQDISFALLLGQGGNWGPTDYVRLSYNLNNGTGWQLFGAFYGTSGTAELRRDADLDGVADAAGTLITSTLQNLDFVLPTALAGAGNISFKIDVANDGGEELAFDLIRITGTSNRPPVIAAQTFSLPENASNNTVVGMVAATDLDAGQMLSYALTGGNSGGAFALNGSTGQLRVANSAALDFETTPTFTLTVQVTDNGTPALSASNVVTVNLTNVNEAPGPVTDVDPAPNAVAEKAAFGTSVGITAKATDPDASTLLTYSLTDNAGGRFSINSRTGVVTVANGQLLDYETATTHTITVQASDGALTSSTSFTIQVTDVPNAAYVNSTTEQLTQGVVAGTADQVILRIPVVLNGNADEPLSATSFTFTTAGTTVPANVAAAHIYYTGTSNRFTTATLFGSVTAPGVGAVVIRGSQVLQPNTNYFWLAYDIAPTATVGNLLDGTLPSLTVSGVSRTPTVTAPAGARPVVSVSGVAGTALRFNGTAAGYVDLGASNPNLVLGQEYTMEIWVKPAAASSTTLSGVLGYDPGPAGQRSPYLSVSEDNRVEAGYGNGSTTITAGTSSNVITTGQWNQLVATYSNSRLSLYINGILYSQTIGGGSPVNTAVRYVGTLAASATTFFKGDIDEVAMWNRVLSLDEIRQRRHMVLTGVETGLASYLQFNEASGNATDPLSGATGPLVGSGVARVPSTVPVSSGVSSLQAVTGNGNVYFPSTNVAINFTGVSGALSVTVARLAGIPQGTTPSGVARTYNQAYWIINKYGSGSFTNAATTYTLGPTDISPADASNPTRTLQLLKRPSNSDGVFDAPLAATTADAVTGTVQFNLSSFSQTVVGSTGSSPLPVELTDFAAKYRRAAVELTWHTATEKNSRHFEVERSADGQAFAVIGTMPAAGSTLSPRTYALTDRALPLGVTVLYYRLRQVDLDGTVAYSMVRVVNVGTATEPVRLLAYPNPARHAIQVYLTGAAPTATLVLLNSLGQVVAQLPFTPSSAEQRVLLPSLPAGLYVLRYGSLTQRLTLE